MQVQPLVQVGHRISEAAVQIMVMRTTDVVAKTLGALDVIVVMEIESMVTEAETKAFFEVASEDTTVGTQAMAAEIKDTEAKMMASRVTTIAIRLLIIATTVMLGMVVKTSTRAAGASKVMAYATGNITTMVVRADMEDAMKITTAVVMAQTNETDQGREKPIVGIVADGKFHRLAWWSFLCSEKKSDGYFKSERRFCRGE